MIYNEENPEVGDGVYDGYDLDCERLTYIYSGGNAVCWHPNKDDNGDWYLDYHSVDLEFVNKTIKVPDSINGKIMHYIVGSSEVKAFDLNPENPYMECVDNVIFSEDKKKLMSYASLNERTEYIIPDGTKIIGEQALFNCENLSQISMPNTVVNIEKGAMWSNDNLRTISFSKNIKVIPDSCFSYCDNLETINIPQNSKLKVIEYDAFYGCNKLSILYLPSFEIEIDRSAFGATYEKTLKTQLKSYVQPQITVSENKLSWEKIPNASYYEIYQKLNSGEYKLLKTTKATACKFTTLKSGKNYTFAVKPVAVIPAANFDKEKDEGVYPETFTIEGTMSEDIVLTGK
ncbi:MAG: leucine-rich repeat domain-containing protein [Oscillospiraceae bacterium]|nr:leucine-rich repeat domain-containing protein [Oscillospiraceae bacterium]